MAERDDAIAAYFNRSVEALGRAAADHDLIAATRAIADAIGRALRADGKVLIAGNGGSAADAQHIAAELLSRFSRERRPLPALALTEPAALTAIGNDTDFSHVFVRQLELLARPEDAALGISTSGASSNVNRALQWARGRGLMTIGFAGRDGGRVPDACDHPFIVKSWSIHRIQETHTALLHLLWDLVHVAMGEDDVL